jgi:electron transfer flavoprotein beta subunit
MAIGIERAILLETDGRDWDPVATAGAIADAIRAEEAAGGPFDLILFGNESADSGGFQVGIRVAAALDRPVVTGIKSLLPGDGRLVARRESISGGWESFDVPLPAVVAVKEGINLPRYPSIPGRLRAKKKEIARSTPEWRAGGLEKIVLRLPNEERTAAEVIGRGADAAPAVVDLLARIGVLDG